MKVLWFTNTPSLYKISDKGYNGGGWIESLEKLLSTKKNIELAVAFFHNDREFKVIQGTTVYYPISLYNSVLKKIKHSICLSKSDQSELDYFQNIIDDFKPNVIHVFGSERSYGLLSKFTKIPVIIHIQGVLNPYKNAFYAPGISKLDLIKSYFFRPLLLLPFLNGIRIFNHNAKREVAIMSNTKYYMGRTQWDKDVSQLYAHNSIYFYCSEVLRDAFYLAAAWTKPVRKKFVIMSTISKSTYKGFDLILKTAKLLKQYPNFDFEWKVFGVKEYREWERYLGIESKEVDVHLMGVVDSATLIRNMQESNLFVHPSYIDNSPNSICEAQMIGLPVIATNVGGIASLVDNHETGLLVPSNDPYTLASRIVKLKNEPDVAVRMGINARYVALVRHNKEMILNDLLNIYTQLQYAKTLDKLF